jgi:uncharacterized protein YjdB
MSIRIPLCALVLLCACQESDDDDQNSRTVVELTVDPARLTMLLGETRMLRATLRYDDGSTEDVTANIAWRSDNESVATVAGGVVTSVGEGVAIITANLFEIRAGSRIEVSKIQLNPMQANLRPGESVTFSVGNTFVSTWTTSDPSVATVDSNGTATAVGSGTATITVTFPNASASGIVNVEPVGSLTISPPDPRVALGETVQLSATGTFSGDVTVDMTLLVAWSSSNPDLTVVDGLVTRNGAGSSTITATFQDKSASVRLGATCSDVIASGLTFEGLGDNAIAMLAADADTLYWYDFDRLTATQGALRWIPKSNGSMLAFVSGIQGVEQFAVDDTHVYWKETPDGQDQYLRRVPKQSVATETIWSSVGLGGGGGGVAVDADYVYWADGAFGGIHRMLKSGGGNIEDFGDGSFSGRQIAVDDEWIYVAPRELDASEVRRANKSTGALETIATGLIDARVQAVDAEAVYAIESQSIVRIPLDGSGSMVLAPVSAGGGINLAIDDRWLYFPDQGAVHRVSKRGGAVETIVESCGTTMGNFSPVSVAVDAERIFLVDRGGSFEGMARILAAPLE